LFNFLLLTFLFFYSTSNNDSDDVGALGVVQEVNQDAVLKASTLAFTGNPLKLFEQKYNGGTKGGEEAASVVEYL
jgi:hypothetical protein